MDVPQAFHPSALAEAVGHVDAGPVGREEFQAEYRRGRLVAEDHGVAGCGRRRQTSQSIEVGLPGLGRDPIGGDVDTAHDAQQHAVGEEPTHRRPGTEWSIGKGAVRG